MGAATTFLEFEGAGQEADATKRALGLNSLESERMAQETQKKTFEDERQFRISVMRDRERNVAAIGASGIRMEGSALEVLRDNASMAEKDIINMRDSGRSKRDAFLKEASNFREAGRSASRAGFINQASAVVKGAGQVAQQAVSGGAGG